MNRKTFIGSILFPTFSFFLTIFNLSAANETLSAGAFIVNMGIVPQTTGNALKPYGMIYDLVVNYKVPIKWVINTTKAKDGTDFTYAGTDFKGGPFIIEAVYRSTSVNARITYWQSQGVVGVTTTTAITVPVYTTIKAMPRWTLDKQNGKIAVGFFPDAGIPPTAHGGTSESGWKLPSQLGCCDDLFVMPHADPAWSTHGNLYTWNQTCNGSIWLGCHAGSALEDMFNPSSPTQQTNFLSEKTGTASGSGPYSENALKLWKNHSNGSPPYTYDYPSDPVMQFMGIMDAATQNGSEQIYLPLSAGWRASTKVGVYDPTQGQTVSGAVQHRAAILAYGRALGDVNRGYAMLEAAHDLGKAGGTASIAAERAFFNFSILSAIERAVTPSITLGTTSDTLYSGVPVNFSFTLPGGASVAGYNIKWTSSCGGTFSPNTTQQNVSFTPGSVTAATPCIIYVTISDACGRSFANDYKIIISCSLSTTSTVTNPSCSGGTGIISFAPTSGSAPYTYNWARGATTGTGTGTTISGLIAGTYNVTVTSVNGCATSFSQTLTAPTPLSITATSTDVLCFGGTTGAINVTASGGTTPYTYNWGGGVATEDRTALAAGTYTVTVTDAKGCTASTSKTITAPSVILSVPGTTTQANCGAATGAINITAAGGTAPYTYNWGGGVTTEDRTALAVGNYTVTVTDANGCTVVKTFTITQPSSMALSTVLTHPTCPLPVADGAIDLSVTGGTSPYTYDWADVAGTSNPQDRTGLSAGTYTVVVTDANGCTATISVTLNTQNSLPSPPTGVNH
ncbi:MAG: SprB repeat-containing protein [Saprospiraceae bacterium]|nr:SprB repeat-containing protein [Saprospiraceae bacterium]